MNSESIAQKIVGMIADGRMTYPLIECVGYWIAQYTAGSEAEHKLLTLAHSIIENIRDLHERNRR